jgi:DNA-directed RNA polymerase I subunit RPA12
VITRELGRRLFTLSPARAQTIRVREIAVRAHTSVGPTPRAVRAPPAATAAAAAAAACRPPRARPEMADAGGAGAPLGRDWMFCPYSGALLTLDAGRGVAASALSGHAVPLEALEDRVLVVHESDMDSYAARYGLEPLVKSAARREAEAALATRTRATVDEPCPRCGHVGLEFYTLQLRSADEGQTVFYECPDCAHKWSQNN